MKNILAKLASWVPTIQVGAIEAIEVLNEIKVAATATGEWADEHEAIIQSNPATATPAAESAQSAT